MGSEAQGAQVQHQLRALAQQIETWEATLTAKVKQESENVIAAISQQAGVLRGELSALQQGLSLHVLPATGPPLAFFPGQHGVLGGFGLFNPAPIQQAQQPSLRLGWSQHPTHQASTSAPGSQLPSVDPTLVLDRGSGASTVAQQSLATRHQPQQEPLDPELEAAGSLEDTAIPETQDYGLHGTLEADRDAAAVRTESLQPLDPLPEAAPTAAAAEEAVLQQGSLHNAAAAAARVTPPGAVQEELIRSASSPDIQLHAEAPGAGAAAAAADAVERSLAAQAPAATQVAVAPALTQAVADAPSPGSLMQVAAASPLSAEAAAVTGGGTQTTEAATATRDKTAAAILEIDETEAAASAGEGDDGNLDQQLQADEAMEMEMEEEDDAEGLLGEDAWRVRDKYFCRKGELQHLARSAQGPWLRRQQLVLLPIKLRVLSIGSLC